MSAEHRPASTQPNNEEEFFIQGCPVADGKPPCIVTCGGNWPGTKASSSDLTEAALIGKLNPDKLGCGIIQANARRGIKILNDKKSKPEP